MSLRVGFDLDGVLADMNGALLREAERLFPGVDLTAPPTPAETAAGETSTSDTGEGQTEAGPITLSLSTRQEQQLWAAVRRVENFWETLNETEPGIIARLAQTARAERWEVIFLTSRPRSAGDPVQIQSQRWLARHGFEFPSLFVVSSSRGRIAAALQLDVVVDDRPENCLDITIDSKARAILIWRGPEGGVPASARRLGIGGVSSVAACLDLLVEATRPDAAAGSLVDRLRRLLRLKPAAAQARV